MALRRVQVTEFRCLQSAAMEFDPRFTLISGPNASGKTSLLEALHVLGRGRSFRTRRLDTLIRLGAERFVVFGEIGLAEREVGLGVEGSSEGVRAKMGGQRARSLAELAAAFPVQIIDPEVHRLIEEGPSRRRQFLDWGVFHVEHGFVGQWQKYQQVLRQRNAAIKARQPRAMVSAWDGELIRLGDGIDAARLQYIAGLAGMAQTIARNLLGMELGLSYRPGWPRELGFEGALKQSAEREVEIGTTVVGPQRAELGIRLNGLPVKDRISRGQQKLLAAALLLAQINLFPEDSLVRPTLLLDDPAAELDGAKLLELISEVSRHSIQLVVTSLSPHFEAFGTPGASYGIDAGKLTLR